jgi:hypothetical protein
MHLVSHLSHAFPGLLPLDHMDWFGQNPLLDRLGLEVVTFSQLKWLPQPRGQGELKKPPELEQCHHMILSHQSLPFMSS